MPDDWIPLDPAPEGNTVPSSWLDATLHTPESDYLSFIYKDNTDNVGVPTNSTPLDPRQNTSRSPPATMFSDLQIDDERYSSTHQQFWTAQHTSGLPSVAPDMQNGDRYGRSATLPSNRFGQSNSHYAPPTYQMHMHHPSAIQEPQLDGLPFRRRGPNINSIEKRRERAPSFFCEVSGCNNVGFTTRASLNRHVNDKHSGKQHLCPICSRAFADSTSVGRHKREKHEDPRVHREDMIIE